MSSSVGSAEKESAGKRCSGKVCFGRASRESSGGQPQVSRTDVQVDQMENSLRSGGPGDPSAAISGALTASVDVECDGPQSTVVVWWEAGDLERSLD